MAKKSRALELAMKQKAKSAKKAENATDESIAKLQERAMLVRLATGRWYGQGNDAGVVNDVKERAKARGDVGTFTKRLMERHHLSAINQVVNDARRYHKEMTLSWSDPFRILSADLFLDYRATMEKFEQRFEVAVREFLERFDSLKEKEKERLGKLYRESDYPKHDQLRARFYMHLRFEAIPDADDFRVRLGGDDIEKVKAEIREQVSEGIREATMELWQRLYSLVQKLRDVLASSDSGVRSALFTNLKDIVALMPRINLTGDPKITALTQRIQKELLAEDVGAVKDDEQLRKSIAAKADSILSAMASFVGEVAEEEK